MTEEHSANATRRRRAAIIVSTVLATIGALIAGVSGQDPWIRWSASGLAVGSAVGSLAMSTKKNSLVGWYAAIAGVLLYRLVKDLLV